MSKTVPVSKQEVMSGPDENDIEHWEKYPESMYHPTARDCWQHYKNSYSTCEAPEDLLLKLATIERLELRRERFAREIKTFGMLFYEFEELNHLENKMIDDFLSDNDQQRYEYLASKRREHLLLGESIS